jgi:aminopeptidase N
MTFPGGSVPEEPEVETEHLHEAIKEELEHEGGAFLRRIALTTALFAALAALASLRAGSTVNEALVLKTEAARLQSEASDQWSYYQAKGVKAAVQEASRAAWLAIGKEPPPDYAQNQQRYSKEQTDIQQKATELEGERDQKSQEADHLLHIHHWFAYAVAILQVAIALGAVGALTRNRPVWALSLLTGAAASILFVLALLR